MRTGVKTLARFSHDRLLELLVALPLGSVRRWAGRKAADRAMHWAALSGAQDDPYTLARLGLYPHARAAMAVDGIGRTGHQLAAAALGRADEIVQSSLAAQGRKKRRLAAKLFALHDPNAALRLLHANENDMIAACLLALDRPNEALAQLHGEQAETREAAAILTHCAISLRNYAHARRSLNALFTRDDLGPVLNSDPSPFGIDDLLSGEGQAQDGAKISVILPYRDAATTLETAVNSLTTQHWRNVEILLVDDRSADDGPSLAQRLAAADDRIIALQNRRNPGVYGARNTAIEAATGDFLTFLDADDWSPAERLSRQCAMLGQHVVSIANHIRMDEGGRPVAPRIFPLIRPVPITMFLRRETLIAAGPFEEVATGADSEMLARLEMQNGKAAIVRDPAVLLVARWRRRSLSQDKEGGLLGQERIMYRADWMFRHAGLDTPCLSTAPNAA